jgi:hypothetical protein
MDQVMRMIYHRMDQVNAHDLSAVIRAEGFRALTGRAQRSIVHRRVLRTTKF